MRELLFDLSLFAIGLALGCVCTLVFLEERGAEDRIDRMEAQLRAIEAQLDLTNSPAPSPFLPVTREPKKEKPHVR